MTKEKSKANYVSRCFCYHLTKFLSSVLWMGSVCDYKTVMGGNYFYAGGIDIGILNLL